MSIYVFDTHSTIITNYEKLKSNDIVYILLGTFG